MKGVCVCVRGNMCGRFEGWCQDGMPRKLVDPYHTSPHTLHTLISRAPLLHTMMRVLSSRPYRPNQSPVTGEATLWVQERCLS